ncbi:hypothetical protein C2G38_688629 [Gigaspora rosea]|uniref:Uncharacterized protein n=1 Tax=Gigaspora rosea TaxID=44941 RepID=A0A397W7K6_9GLOM|nr:hypothetical protein C2G38_688629 [Gigaspora rosea]
MLPSQRRKNNWFPNIIFYEAHVYKLRDLIRDIQNNKWTTLERPYVPPSIVEITLAEDQSETEISQIKKGLEDLTSIKPDLASIKNGLEGLTRVKKELEELTSIKKELKGLTSLFDNFKNEVMTELNKLQTS